MSPFLSLRDALLAIINKYLMYEMSCQVKSDVFIQYVCACPHRVGHNEIIGVMRLGCHAEGLGRDHWNEMLAYPRKPIAHWHPLLESKKSEKEVGLVLETFIKEYSVCDHHLGRGSRRVDRVGDMVGGSGG